MKVVINTINFYNNIVVINHVQNIIVTVDNGLPAEGKIDKDNLKTVASYPTITQHPLIAQLEARIRQSEHEKQELMDL